MEQEVLMLKLNYCLEVLKHKAVVRKESRYYEYFSKVNKMFGVSLNSAEEEELIKEWSLKDKQSLIEDLIEKLEIYLDNENIEPDNIYIYASFEDDLIELGYNLSSEVINREDEGIQLIGPSTYYVQESN